MNRNSRQKITQTQGRTPKREAVRQQYVQKGFCGGDCFIVVVKILSDLSIAVLNHALLICNVQ